VTINVDFDKTGQLDFKKAYDSVRREVLYKILIVWYPHDTGKANKNMSE
jgi:hypothetical protein